MDKFIYRKDTKDYYVYAVVHGQEHYESEWAFEQSAIDRVEELNNSNEGRVIFLQHQHSAALDDIKILAEKLRAIEKAVDSMVWGYDGDCGLGVKIDRIINGEG